MSRWRRLVPGTAFVFYLLIALEAVIMITPFTAYFYAVYAPVLNRLEAHPWTAWLTAFFLPHITYTGDPILTALAWLGPVLLTLGLGIFLVCAGQVYSAKLFRRGVVSGGLYRFLRHPQYLGLGIAGLGLLLYWPRFIILLLYLSMLLVYYLLARHEEARMEARFGEVYRRYRDATWMFLPGEPGGKVFSWVFGRTSRRAWVLAAVCVGVLVLGTGVAFGLRLYSLARVPMVRYSDMITAVSLSPADGAAIERTLATVVTNPEVATLLTRFHQEPGHTLVAYIVPRAYMMQHLIADLGEHEAHHGKGEQKGVGAVVRHLGEMYALAPLRQLRDGTLSPEKRIIFTEALTAAGARVPVSRALDADVLRYPLFFADLDGSAVAMTMETPRRHRWGTIPVPAF
jgi:protein-S-isoprenylcysteine O-methyltransferase Ste14